LICSQWLQQEKIGSMLDTEQRQRTEINIAKRFLAVDVDKTVRRKETRLKTFSMSPAHRIKRENREIIPK
jgi:hypothetical protein